MDVEAEAKPVAASTTTTKKKETRKQVLTPPAKVSLEDVEITFDGRFGLYDINFLNGFKTPTELIGQWTEMERAQKAVDLYFAKLSRN
jgi:hypothetical protein